MFFVCFSREVGRTEELRSDERSGWEKFFGVGRRKTSFCASGGVEKFTKSRFFVPIFNIFGDEDNSKVEKRFVVFDISSHMFRKPRIKKLTNLRKTSTLLFFRTRLK